MRIAVAMALYNGKAYIEQQLDSLLNQTVLPDQIVICDDGSTDGSLEFVTSYAANHPHGERICLAQNAKNLGYTQNFYRAVSLCRADLIFLCDQDDIWRSDKIEEMRDAFAANDSIDLIASAHTLIDGEGHPITSARYPDSPGTGALLRIDERAVVSQFRWPGMCMAMTNAFWQEVRGDAVRIHAPHDRVFALLAASRGGFAFLDTPLASHRRHADNSGGEEHRASSYLRRSFKRKELGTSLQWLDGQIAEANCFSSAAQDALRSYRDYVALRLEALEKRSPLLLAKAWRAGKGCRSIKGILADLVSMGLPG